MVRRWPSGQPGGDRPVIGDHEIVGGFGRRIGAGARQHQAGDAGKPEAGLEQAAARQHGRGVDAGRARWDRPSVMAAVLRRELVNGRWRCDHNLRECLMAASGTPAAAAAMVRRTATSAAARLAHIPLADAIAARRSIRSRWMWPRDAVGAGPEHGGEAMAGALAQVLAQRPWRPSRRSSRAAAVGEREGAHVDGVALAVLAELGAGDPVAAAAFEVIVGLDCCAAAAPSLAARGAASSRSQAGNGLGHAAAQHRRGPQRDALARPVTPP